MPGHQNLGGPGMTQNQGNILGDHPCVRQSRLYREHVGGNTMKELMGQEQLKWDVTKTQGAYEGGKVFGESSKVTRQPQSDTPSFPQPSQQQPQQQAGIARGQGANRRSEEEPVKGHRKGAGEANKTTCNIFSQ